MPPGPAELPLQYFLENEYGSILSIFNWMANQTGSVYTDSTAVVPPEAAYSSIALSAASAPGQDFLLNFKKSSLDLGLPIGVGGYFGFPSRSSIALRHLSEEEDLHGPEEVINLPSYRNLKDSLGVTIRSRRSLREFSDKSLSLRDLSTVLFYANGVTGDIPMVAEDDPEWPQQSLGPPEHASTRAASSGGGLNPISLYLVIQNVKTLEDGLYVYLPLQHSLKLLTTFDDKQRDEHRVLCRSWGPNFDPAMVNATIYYVYTVYENSRKYADMGPLFAILEAGEIAAHVHLVCTAMRMGSSDVGGWEKVPTERFMSLDGLSKQVVHATAIGTL